MPGLLRICTAGSVDDGKSTLIGRLLYDSRGVYEDQVQSVRAASRNRDRRADRLLALHRRPARRARAGHHHRRRLSLLRDGAPEVHPGRHARARAVHAQHGDRRLDGRPRDPARRRASRRPRQTRRHARIARLLGISSFVLAINKMDLRRLRRAASSTRSATTSRRARRRARAPRHSDQRAPRRQRDRAERPHALVRRSEPARVSRDRGGRAPHAAAAVPVPGAARDPPGSRVPRLRRTDRVGRGPRVGDRVTVWPSGRTTRVTRIVTWDGDLDVAFAPMSVTLVLDDEIDISRGDVLADGPDPGRPPVLRQRGLDGRAAARSRARSTS